MKHLLMPTALLLLMGPLLPVAQAGDSQDMPGTPTIIVNEAPLTPQQIMQLQLMYRVQIPPGRYWYDRISGIWGVEGGPGIAQILPWLPIGGPLRPDASHGTTGVFVNGRQLHLLEVVALLRCTRVFPGRYWINSAGIGGYEGGPAIFDLARLCAPVSSRSSTQTELSGGGGAWSANSRTGTGVTTDGHGHAAVFMPGGGMVTTP